MGFENRHYYRQPQSYGGSGGGGGGFTRFMGLPPLTPMVKYIMIGCVAVFFLQRLSDWRLSDWFAATGISWQYAIQIWRLLTFQFLHGGFYHLLVNMVALYFFGTTLERTWGSKEFLRFYLFSGALGGLIYVVISRFGYFPGTLVGASGGILGVIAVCAIIFPQMKVFLLPFPIPIPIRVLTAFIMVAYIISVLHQGVNAGGDLCHLGGMAGGFIWVFGKPYFSQFWAGKQKGAFQKKLDRQQKLEYEVDRILAKVNENGIQSLTRKEKETLRQATEQQKRQQF